MSRWATPRSVLAWWALLALGLWLVGLAVGRPSGLVACGASAALFVAIGEAGDALRRRRARRRAGKSSETGDRAGDAPP